MKKRLLSVLLTLCLIVQVMPAISITVQAAEETETVWEYEHSSLLYAKYSVAKSTS